MNKTRTSCTGVAIGLIAPLSIYLQIYGASASEWMPYVSDGASAWANFDIFAIDLSSGTTTQLTTDAEIDNHPDISPDGKWVVWSSTRGNGEFDLYLGDFTNVEATARRLTDDSYTNGPQTKYPDRHPHFHPTDPTIVIFSSKNQPLESPIEIISECSSPKIIVPPRFYEKMNVITLSSSGTVVNYTELDVRNAWNKVSQPTIWSTNTDTYVGHPSFSHDGTQIVFSASIDGDGKVWEVYCAGFRTNPPLGLVSNSLRRVTAGPVIGNNPIQMSGGAHFTEDDSAILFSSTRTPGGNSLIFSVPAGSADVPVTSATQKTLHTGNDYVPEPLMGGAFMVSSDLGSPGMCGTPTGPTRDLDLVLVTAGGTRTNLTDNDTSDEMMLIGDEVSWFCGLSPNLSSCRSVPRIFSIESLWLELSAWMYVKGYATNTPIPDNLLAAFGYPDQAVRMYATGWENMDEVMSIDHSQWGMIHSELQALNGSCFPGLGDETALRTWMHDFEPLRTKKHVVESIMYSRGLGAAWTPWVTAWLNPTGGAFDAPGNWDLGAPRSNDIVRFDGTALGGPTTIQVDISNTTRVQAVEIEMVALSLVGTGTNLLPLNISSNLQVGGGTGVTITVATNIHITITNNTSNGTLRMGTNGDLIVKGGRVTADKISVSNDNTRIWMVDSFFDVFTEIKLEGATNRMVAATGAVVRLPGIKLDGPGNRLDVEKGLLYVTNTGNSATVNVTRGEFMIAGGTAIVNRLVVTGLTAAVVVTSGVLRVDSSYISNGLPCTVGHDNTNGDPNPPPAILWIGIGTNVYPFGCNIGRNGILRGKGVFDLRRQDLIMIVRGAILPGDSPGIITVLGSLGLTNSSLIDIEIGGPNAGTEYDRVAVSGNAYLDGTLRATLISNYMPAIGQSFEVMTYSAASNTFDTLSLPILNADRKWSVTYGGTSLVLAVSAIPDTDGDGMDDDWETNNFAVLTASDGTGDMDDDGATDHDEYVALTQPTNSDSVLRISACSISDYVIRVTFPAVGGVPYALDIRTNLTPGETWIESSNSLATEGEFVFSNVPPAYATNYFYRIKVKR